MNTKIKTVMYRGKRVRIEANISKAAKDLFKRGVFVSVTFQRPSSKKQVDAEERGELITRTHNPDKYDVSRKIMDWGEYDAIAKFETKTRAHVRSLELPFDVPIFKQGTYMIPKNNIQEVLVFLKKSKLQYPILLRALEGAYEQRKRDDKRKFPDDYNEADYPPVGKFMGRFDFDYEINYIDVPQIIEDISPEMFQEQVRKREERMASWVISIEQAVIFQLASAYKFFVSKLNGEETTKTGRRKTFKEDSLVSLKEAAQGFKNLNITDNQTLNAEITNLERILDGVTPDELKFDDTKREEIFLSASVSLEKLEAMMIEAPSRKVKIRGGEVYKGAEEIPEAA